MAEYPAGEITYKGVTVPIRVDDSGQWNADLAGAFHRADTRDGLENLIKRAVTRNSAKIAVSFSQLIRENNQFMVRRGVAYGVHWGTGRVMVRWDDTGAKEQLDGLDHHRPVAGPLTEQEAARWAELANRRYAVITEIERFQRDHKLYLKDAIREAADQAADDTSLT